MCWKYVKCLKVTYARKFVAESAIFPLAHMAVIRMHKFIQMKSFYKPWKKILWNNKFSHKTVESWNKNTKDYLTSTVNKKNKEEILRKHNFLA